jgi:hypothetical protein
VTIKKITIRKPTHGTCKYHVDLKKAEQRSK